MNAYTYCSAIIGFFAFLKLLDCYLDKKWVFKELPIQEDYSNWNTVDIFEENLQHMSSIIGKKMSYAGGSVVKYLSYINLNHKNPDGERQLDCDHVQIKVMQILNKKTDKNLMRFFVEKHYGQPSWDGSEMHYNYYRITEEFSCPIEDFENTWNKIKDFCYKIKTSECESERVKNGTMSYWTEKEYGHMI